MKFTSIIVNNKYDFVNNEYDFVNNEYDFEMFVQNSVRSLHFSSPPILDLLFAIFNLILVYYIHLVYLK